MSGVGFDFYSVNASSLELTASVYNLLKQEQSFALIDLCLEGIYSSIPSIPSIPAAESVFLS